ncbi:hypothetical protein AB0950_25020 [Streptomyces sp. NPDC007189]|uniref:hypothetical protein n=1 Tax=unclassified Streptomyces TaxID=2593676 RepID=UPI0033F84A35
MPSRTFTVVGAGAGATVLAAAGLTYALTAGSAPASASVHQAAAPAHRAAAPHGRPAAKPAQPVAKPVQRSAPATAPQDGMGSGGRNEGRDGGGRGHGRGHREDGRIYFNERTYPAAVDGCITAASGFGASSFSVFNDSRRTVEVFRGFTCDNGAPVAVVGPHGRTYGVVTRTDHGDEFGEDGGVFARAGLFDDGVAGSFRVVGGPYDW